MVITNVGTAPAKEPATVKAPLETETCNYKDETCTHHMKTPKTTHINTLTWGHVVDEALAQTK